MRHTVASTDKQGVSSALVSIFNEKPLVGTRPLCHVHACERQVRSTRSVPANRANLLSLPHWRMLQLLQTQQVTG